MDVSKDVAEKMLEDDMGEVRKIADELEHLYNTNRRDFFLELAIDNYCLHQVQHAVKRMLLRDLDRGALVNG